MRLLAFFQLQGTGKFSKKLVSHDLNEWANFSKLVIFHFGSTWKLIYWSISLWECIVFQNDGSSQGNCWLIFCKHDDKAGITNFICLIGIIWAFFSKAQWNLNHWLWSICGIRIFYFCLEVFLYRAIGIQFTNHAAEFSSVVSSWPIKHQFFYP